MQKNGLEAVAAELEGDTGAWLCRGHGTLERGTGDQYQNRN